MKRICFVEKLNPKKEQRKINRKIKFKSKIDKIKVFYYNHQEEILVFGPMIIGALGVIFKFTTRQIKVHNQKQLKDLYCYDRSLGHYWKLRRELTNDEWVEVDKRKADGERLADILDEMKVLR